MAFCTLSSSKMAEQIPFSTIADVLTKLGSLAFQQIGSAFGVTKELTKLTKKLDTIKGVLVDAEKRQEESDAVKAWVRRLKDVVYDADDLLDDFEMLQLQRGGVARQVSDFFSSSNQVVLRFKMSDRLKDIKEEVEEIVKEIPMLKLIQGKVVQREVESSRRETHSFVLTSEMVGRDEDKEEIIKLLVSSGNEKNLSAVAIIGIGGLGKTALAQLVYNDMRVVDFFQPKIWICVSDDFDVKLLVKKILESLSGGDVDLGSLNVLKDSLHEKIRQKRYLLVLDDVWNDDFQKWEELRTLLMVGDKGSRILVTTRNRNVASTMGIDHFPFSLKGLKENQSWNLFLKIAFEEGQERLYPSLVEIGKEIVNMCKGVPLILKTLGAILRIKTEESMWLSIKNNKNLLLLEGENNGSVLSVLKLSYDALPFHLKQCFGYCALFPKDYEIEKKVLVQLWMAQGYIQASGVGNRYFEELLSRSLLEEVTKDAYDNISYCKMHDLIHDLAQSVVGFEVLGLGNNVKEILERVYHISFSNSLNLTGKDLKIKHIRTMLKVNRYSKNDSVVHTLIPNFKSLRVLSLHGFSVKKVLKSLGKMSHLRYLDLSYNNFKVLPNAITWLYNLQTLKLINCGHVKKFPKDMRRLINLRHLENQGCGSLTHMTCGIGELSLLESLPLFVVGTGSKVGRLSELKRLNNLRGQLWIEKLENVMDAKVESREANLVEKQYIESLGLEWSYGQEEQSGEDAESVMVGLQPHRNLKELFIIGYGGKGFPRWMMNGELSTMLPNLTTIYLASCLGCQTLPCIVRLRHLRSLKLHHLGKVEYMECSSEGPFFPSLQNLYLSFMPKLKELWRRDLATQPPPSFPCLSLLLINKCDDLASLELYPSPCISSIEITYCPKLTSLLLPPSPLLSQLEIRYCGDLASLELHSSHLLSSLYISHCLKPTSLKLSSLPCLESLCLNEVKEGVLRELMSATASSLKSVRIQDIDDLMSLPDELHQHVSTLQTLKIGDCSHLATLPHWIGNLTSLTHLRITNCPELTSLPQEMHSLTALHTLSIDYSCGLASLPSWIGGLTSLTDLEIGSCPELTSLPEELHCLRILKSLTIHDWSSLTTLPAWIGSLSSLEYLQIRKCPKLTSLPEEMRSLTTLYLLEISECPYLSKRCQREKGEDWPKIAHVRIKVDDGFDAESHFRYETYTLSIR